MKLASKGLGAVTLPFSLKEADIKEENGELWLHGAIKEKKVHWVYKMRLEDADIINFVALAKNDEIVAYLAQRCGFRLFFIALTRIFKTIVYFLNPKSSSKIINPDKDP